MVKLKRKFAGVYDYFLPNGKKFHIFRNDERDSTWFGQWMIETCSESGYVLSNSDPMPTLTHCREAIADMLANPTQYELE